MERFCTYEKEEEEDDLIIVRCTTIFLFSLIKTEGNMNFVTKRNFTILCMDLKMHKT